MPFVTETLWTTLTGGESVVVADWPRDSGFRDAAAEAEIDGAPAGGHRGPPLPRRPGPPARPEGPGPADPRRHRARRRTRPPSASCCGSSRRARASRHGDLPVAGATVALDLSGTIDVAAERKRLAKDLAAAEKEKAQADAKLGNEAFLAKAPDQVVDKIRARLAKAEADIDRIQAQLTPPAPRRSHPHRATKAPGPPGPGAFAVPGRTRARPPHAPTAPRRPP